MARVITINRPDVVALIEKAAEKLTRGNKTEAVALGMDRLLKSEERTGSLFGAHPNSFRMLKDVDLTQPVIDLKDINAENGRPDPELD